MNEHYYDLATLLVFSWLKCFGRNKNQMKNKMQYAIQSGWPVIFRKLKCTNSNLSAMATFQNIIIIFIHF